mgnify:CR=1 FL=1
MSRKRRKCVLLVRFGENEQHSCVPQVKLTAAAVKECGKRKYKVIMVITEHLCDGKPLLTNGLAEAIRMCKKDCDDISLIVVCNPQGHVMSDEEKYMTDKMASDAGIEISWLDKVPPVDDETSWCRYLWRYEYLEEEN